MGRAAMRLVTTIIIVVWRRDIGGEVLDPYSFTGNPSNSEFGMSDEKGAVIRSCAKRHGLEIRA